MWKWVENRWVKGGVTVEGLGSFVGMLFSAISAVVGMMGALLSWLDGASYLMAGVAFLAFSLATAFVLLIAATAAQKWYFPERSMARSGVASDEAVGINTQKLTLFGQEHLYVGGIQVGHGDVLEQRLIHIGLRCFNASSRSVSIGKIEGEITIGEFNSQESYTQLPEPWLSDKYQTRDIPAHSEFHIGLEQRLPLAIAEKILSISQDFSLRLNFDGLRVRIVNSDIPSEWTILPIWHAVRLFKNSQRMQVGRIHTVSGTAAVSVT